MALTRDQAIQRGGEVFAQVVGYQLDPSSGVWDDFQSMYNKSTDYRQMSDAAGDFASGLSNPEGYFEQQLQAYVPVLVARYIRPTYSNAGVGGDDDPGGTLGTWTPPPAVQQVLQQAAVAYTAAANTAPYVAPAAGVQPYGAGPQLQPQIIMMPQQQQPQYLPMPQQSAGGGLGNLKSLPLLALGGAVLYLVIRK